MLPSQSGPSHAQNLGVYAGSQRLFLWSSLCPTTNRIPRSYTTSTRCAQSHILRRRPPPKLFWTLCMSLLHLQLTPVTAVPTYEPRVAVTVTQRHGLMAGGQQGPSFRRHVHLVEQLPWEGAISGTSFSVSPLRDRAVIPPQRQDLLRRSRECLSWFGTVGASLLCDLKKSGIGSLCIPP